MTSTPRLSPQKTAILWKSCHVARWHSNEHLAHTHDPLNGHSGRVAVLMRSLWPDAPANVLWACVVHDLPEYIVGDVSAVSKQDNPKFNAALDILEAETAKKMECEYLLDDRWQERLNLCDRLDALLFAQLHRPDLMQRGEWIESKARIFGMADACGVNLEVADIIRWAA